MTHMTAATIEPDVRSEAGVRSLLISALEEEVGLLDRLRDIFATQRDALAAGDPGALDDGVFAATRVMRTMDEARRRRRKLTVSLLGADVDFEEWDAVLTGPKNRPIRIAQDQVRAAAARLRSEVRVLRQVLQVALSDNRRYLETLLGQGAAAPATPQPSYDTVAAKDALGAGAVLDRTG